MLEVIAHVAPTLLFTVTSFPVMPPNSLAVPSPSLSVYQCTNWYGKFVQAKFHDCFCTATFCFIWTNFLYLGIVDISVQSAGTGKYATPTNHLNFHFKPLAVAYDFSHNAIKDNWISSRLNLTVHSSILLENSGGFSFGKGAVKVAILRLSSQR